MRRAARVALASGVTGGCGALATVIGSVLVVRGRAAGHLYSEADVPAAGVALVLGAQVYPDGTPSAFLAGRLDLARRLVEAGTISWLLLSGDARAPEYDEPTAMRGYLVAAGVPADRLVLDPYGLDTYDSCVRARQVYGLTRLVVVTQAYHLPRAVGTARWVGIDAVGVGDRSVRPTSWAWRQGWVRDQVACVKTLLDLAARRQPVQSAADDIIPPSLHGRPPP